MKSVRRQIPTPARFSLFSPRLKIEPSKWRRSGKSPAIPSEGSELAGNPIIRGTSQKSGKTADPLLGRGCRPDVDLWGALSVPLRNSG